MADSTSTSIQSPAIPTGQELFDWIMGQIEPELTTAGVKTLAAKYKDETPEQQLARRKRYELAYKRYDEAYTKTVDVLQAQMMRYRRSSFDEVEQESRAREQARLQTLSSAFS